MRREWIILSESERLKRVISYILTILILLCMAVFIFFLYFINKDLAIQMVGSIALVLVGVLWVVFEYRKLKEKPVVHVVEDEIPIKRLILITRDGEREKEWLCEGRTSFLIGKGTPSKEVDIELGDTHYSEFVSNQHAVLNYSNGYWYIEDLNSINGVGIKKKGESYALRLKPMVAYKIDEGDIVYISKAKILVR